MIKLHVTVLLHKKLLSLPSDSLTLNGVMTLIKEKFSSLPKKILIQYLLEEENFSDWIDLDEDTIKTLGEGKIHKLQVVSLDEPDLSFSSSSQQPQADDDILQGASTSHTVPAVCSEPTQTRSVYYII